MLDVVDDRKGEWMHTASGKKFFPLDPRPEDICINDIANGLALDCRYGGQGRVDRFYSVAEHCWHIASYARLIDNMPAAVCMAALLHDAAEAYINDLPRAVKHSVGEGYEYIEEIVQETIIRKYRLSVTALQYAKYIKDLDCRIVPHEKEAIMRYPQEWAYDKFDPLPGVVIYCYEPATAKRRFLAEYILLCKRMNIEPEECEI